MPPSPGPVGEQVSSLCLNRNPNAHDTGASPHPPPAPNDTRQAIAVTSSLPPPLLAPPRRQVLRRSPSLGGSTIPKRPSFWSVVHPLPPAPSPFPPPPPPPLRRFLVRRVLPPTTPRRGYPRGTLHQRGWSSPRALAVPPRTFARPPAPPGVVLPFHAEREARPCWVCSRLAPGGGRAGDDPRPTAAGGRGPFRTSRAPNSPRRPPPPPSPTPPLWPTEAARQKTKPTQNPNNQNTKNKKTLLSLAPRRHTRNPTPTPC